jgi:hypothetical protein
MKNTLIRILTLATLASSMSAFAAAGDSKGNDSANPSAANQQQGCNDTAQEGKEQKKAKKQQHEETQEEKDFNRLLMGTYG